MRRWPPVHPALVAAFPVLSLWSANATEVDWRHVVWPLAITLAATVATQVVLSLGTGNWHAGARATTAILVLVFSFGRIAPVVDRIGVATNLLLALWIALAGVALVMARLTRTRGHDYTYRLNILGACLVVIPITSLAMSGTLWHSPVPTPRGPVGATTVNPPADPPDLWFIVLDRYASRPTLEREYGTDNAEFYAALAERGFAVNHDAVANYGVTAQSLASMLNLSYLDEVLPDGLASVSDWEAMYELIRDHRLGSVLSEAGYRYHHVGNWWEPTRRARSADVVVDIAERSEFAWTLYRTTVVPYVAAILGADEPNDDRYQYEVAREQFRVLGSLPDRPGPDFVFAHLTIPHPPYIFDEGGSYVPEQERSQRTEAENYRRQLAYTNERVLEVVDHVLAMEEPAVVLLQADEGPYPRGTTSEDFPWSTADAGQYRHKFGALSALRIPSGDPATLLARTPVNTVRNITNLIAGTDLPPLPARQRVFASPDRPYVFIDITRELSARGP